jgi:putative transposase
VPGVAGPCFVGDDRHAGTVRTAYRCRAYPDQAQQAVLNRTFGCVRRQLAYKCQRYGRQLVVIDRWYPSSKTGSACGHLLAELSLSTRTWQCPSCGTQHDRDVNAAKNILAAGQAVTACGADVSHSGTSRVQSAVKQESRPVTAGSPVLQGGE